MWRKVCIGIALLALTCIPVRSQGQSAQVTPVPIPGGDIISPVGLVNQFFPGVGAIYDGQDAEPHGITNFKGHVAMGYTLGAAMDNAGKQYAVITDIRVYEGEYVGAQPTFNAGGSTSAKAHGTFVEI